jgi:hypothetical protein
VDKRKQTILLIVLHYIKYCLCSCKLRRILPTYANVRYSLEGMLGQLRTRERWRDGINKLAEYVQGVLL